MTIPFCFSSDNELSPGGGRRRLGRLQSVVKKAKRKIRKRKRRNSDGHSSGSEDANSEDSDSSLSESEWEQSKRG